MRSKHYDDIAIHMLENHGIDLLDSEISDIVHVCAPALQHAGQGAKLSSPAMVGGTRFGVGVSEKTVIERAQREYEYSLRPGPTHEQKQEARELINRIVPRIDAGGANPIDPKLYCCEHRLHIERERIHAEFDALLSAAKGETE